MEMWQASAARQSFAEIFEGAAGGRPQLIQRRDGREVVVVSRDYFERTRPNLKSFLLSEGYSGDGEDAFDAILEEVRGSSAGVFAPRGSIQED